MTETKVRSAVIGQETLVRRFSDAPYPPVSKVSTAAQHSGDKP